MFAYGFGGLLADATGKGLQIGVGRGSAVVVMASGICLALVAVILPRLRQVQNLEKRG